MVTTVPFANVVYDSAREVFESMVFMPIEKPGEAARDLDDVTLLATITFRGHLEGCFHLRCGRSGAAAVAANMLCMDSTEALSDDDVSDAIGEIANMIMGSVKTRIQDKIPNLEISIPSVVEGRQIRNRPGEGMARVAVDVSIGHEHRAELSLLYREGNG